MTATSVGITARVFGDLRALATTEARIVLGAAVADDVLGLVILTIVVKVVTEGSVGPGLVAETVGAAVGFLVVATLVGAFIVPWCFEQLRRVTRSAATVVVLGFALTLGFAWAATLAKLAPIIGAFVAGLAIGRSPEHARIERDFAPTANLLIPVFFVQIGLERRHRGDGASGSARAGRRAARGRPSSASWRPPPERSACAPTRCSSDSG